MSKIKNELSFAIKLGNTKGFLILLGNTQSHTTEIWKGYLTNNTLKFFNVGNKLPIISLFPDIQNTFFKLPAFDLKHSSKNSKKCFKLKSSKQFFEFHFMQYYFDNI